MKLVDVVLNFLYPNICGICEKVCKDAICKNCMNKLYKEYVSGRKIYIQTKNRYIDEHIYLFRYKEKIKELILGYKFKEKPYLYKSFAYMILKDEKIMRVLKKYDFIIPVPIHKKRKKYRGYNQSELIIKEICTKDKTVKFDNNILIKEKNIKPQSSLKKEERKLNILNVYDINKEKINYINEKSIILFDDIYTTGSTVNECAKVLKKYGAKSIGVLTIAKD